MTDKLSKRRVRQMRILVLYGPNLNLLGTREPEIYGTLTLDEINQEIIIYAEKLNQGLSMKSGTEQIELDYFQSNHEGVLIDTIQEAQQRYEGIIYNPAAHTHYSIALRDAIASISIPVVEVHLTDISQREDFRSVSVMKDVCIGQCMGRHIDSYKEALDMLVAQITARGEEGQRKASEWGKADAMGSGGARSETGGDRGVVYAERSDE